MDPQTQEILNKIASAAGDGSKNKRAVETFTKAIHDMVDKGMLADAREIARNAIKTVMDNKDAMPDVASKAVKALSSAINKGLTNMLTEIKSTTSRELVDALSPDKLLGGFEKTDFTESGIIKSLYGLREKISSAKDDIKKDLNIEDLVVGFGAERAISASLDSNTFKKIEGFDQMITGQYMNYQKLGVDLNRALGTPFKSLVQESGQTATASAATFRKQLMDGTSDLQIHFGADGSEATQDLVGISKQFFDLQRQVKDGGLQIKFESLGEEDVVLSEMASISVLAKSLNKDAATVAGYVNDMTSTWATGGAIAKESLLDIARAAAAGGLPVERTFNLVSELNGKFSEMGEMSRGLSATFAQFAQNLGPQKLGQAISAVKNLATGIAGMSDETKAFIALGSDSLGGGGTAIESIIRMEDAIASGDQDKLREIQEEMAAKIEELSGGAMLTREEAVATGQEERFFTQAKLAEQLGASSGRTGYSAFVQGMRGDTQMGVGDLKGGEQELVSLEMQRGMQAVSPTELLKRKAQGVQTRFASGNADVIEEHMAGPLKEAMSKVQLGKLSPAELKKTVADMVGSLGVGMVYKSSAENVAEGVTAEGMSKTSQITVGANSAAASISALTAGAVGAGDLSSTTGITLASNKAQMSAQAQSDLAAQGLLSSGEKLDTAAAALTDAADYIKASGGASSAPVTVSITINGGDVAQIRHEVQQAISGALGNGAPMRRSSAAPPPMK